MTPSLSRIFAETFSRKEGSKEHSPEVQTLLTAAKNEHSVSVRLLCRDGLSMKSRLGFASESRCCFRNVEPGRYQILLETTELWAGDLEAKHLIYGDVTEPLKMAADSDEANAENPQLAFEVFERALIVEVFAGFESGLVRITHIEKR